jgi:hypothetical protein
VATNPINTVEELRQAIHELEVKNIEQAKRLKQSAQQFYQSVKPSSLLRNTLKEVTASPDIKNNLLNTVIGLGVGFVSDKLLIGKAAAGVVKNLAGTAIQLGVTSAISKKMSTWKNKFAALLHKRATNRKAPPQQP